MKIDFDTLADIPSIDLLATQLVEGFITGLHKSPYHGFSVEFAEHKHYNTGESTRHIDWKLFAKTDRLYSKKYDEETNLRCYVVMDTSSSMYFPIENKAKLKFSILAAASILNLLHRQRDSLGLIHLNEKIDFFSENKSSSVHLRSLFKELTRVYAAPNEQKKLKLGENLHYIAERIHKRSLVIIFSDFLNSEEELNELYSAIQHLKHKNHEVIVFKINDAHTELNFNFDDRPYDFQDIESGSHVKLNPYEVKKEYQERINSYYKTLETNLLNNKVDYYSIDTAEDMNMVLQKFLIKRSKMR